MKKYLLVTLETSCHFFAEPTKPTINVPRPGKKIPIGDGSPVIMNIGDNVTAASDTTITIRCPVSGVPTPSITWTKDGKQLSPADNVAITSDNSLVITQAGAEYSGKYTCDVEGVAGSDTGSSVVQILGEYRLFYYSFSLYESKDYSGELQKLIPCTVETYFTGSRYRVLCEYLTWLQ